MIRLSTSRLLLRTLGSRDVELLYDFDVRNRSWLEPWEPRRDEAYFTRERVASSIRADARALRRGTGARWHVFRHGEPGRILGSVSVSNIVLGVFLSAHLGYRLDAEETDRGFMTEALEAVIAHAFGPWGLHRLEANVMPRNLPSRRVLARLGFEEEGLARRYLKINGVWEDHLHHVRLNETLEGRE